MADTGELLRRIIQDGTPDPLADLADGTHAIIDPSHSVTVFDALPDTSWRLTAACHWPQTYRRARNVWAAIAPGAAGIVLVNLSLVDIGTLDDPVRWCLGSQRARHGAHMRDKPRAGRRRAVLRDGMLTFTGSSHLVQIGAPYTAGEDAYTRTSREAFEFLSPALGVVARIIAEHGPISRPELATAVYGIPSRKNANALEMTLSRLRQRPDVELARGLDGRLTIRMVDAAAHA
jgi:hypothetical protein